MNLFALSDNPIEAAKFHHDSHVVKMVTETAQILNTVLHKHNLPAVLAKTHENHPCTIWAGLSVATFSWTISLGLNLSREYTYRYGKIHKSEASILHCLDALTSDSLQLPNIRLTETPFVQAMPQEYRGLCPVTAYRNYYLNKKLVRIDGRLNRWTKRPIPAWVALSPQWKQLQKEPEQSA